MHLSIFEPSACQNCLNISYCLPQDNQLGTVAAELQYILHDNTWFHLGNCVLRTILDDGSAIVGICLYTQQMLSEVLS